MLRPIALTIAWLLAFPAAGLAQDKPDTAKKTCPTYDIDQLTELLKKETSCRAAVHSAWMQ